MKKTWWPWTDQLMVLFSTTRGGYIVPYGTEGSTTSWHVHRAKADGSPDVAMTGADADVACQLECDFFAAAPAMARLLCSLEWSVDGACPSCERERCFGHKPDSALDLVLTKAGITNERSLELSDD